MKKSSSPPTLIRRGLLLCGIVCALTFSASAQQPPPAPVADPFAPPPATGPPQSDPFLKTTPLPPPAPGAVTNESRTAAKEGLVRLEFFSLPPKTARRVLRMYPSQADLYQWVESQLETEGSEVTVEHVTVLRVRNDQEAQVDEITEYPFATEWDPPSIPVTLGIGVPLTLEQPDNPPSSPPVPPSPTPPPPPTGAQGETGMSGFQAAVPAVPTKIPGNFFKTQITPQSIEFKNTGITFEANVLFTENESLVNVQLALERTLLADVIDIDAAGELRHPIFSSQKIAGVIAVKAGTPAFVGTFSPPSRIGTSNEEQISRIWLLFLTVDPVSR